ncbi:tRNA(Met) cytidine acetyltransferase, partial [Modicisalibacter tunisiensis]|uniref:tRNA(Met) cytidine acetyltransferase TmcA domain-containing protein n=1 Tax=Modicisalibacter tunisiensis TaxID=390637 RepID=UPI001CC96629
MHDSLIAALATLRHTLTDRRHRGLLWADGEAAILRERALGIWRGGDWQAPLWLGPTAPADDIPVLPAAKARTRLGGEHELVVVDAASPDGGFDPEAFGAVAGTVRAGGLLVLLTPADWRTGTPRPDADYARLASWPHAVDSLGAHTLARLARCLRTADAVLRWPAEAECPDLTLPAPIKAASPPDVADPDCLSADQAEAVRRLTRLRRRRPLVISADRGRGKSAALGIAAARRLAG